jgi:hypothetical protein
MDYEKKYKEAIERLQNAFYDNNSRMCEEYRKAVIKIIEPIFPELKEPEDEKVRKALIEMVHDTTGDELWVDYNVHKEEALAWLEKQGEQKHIIEMKSAEESLGISSKEYNDIVNDCLCGEPKPVDARENLTLDGDLMEADCMIVEQKSWSEEDEAVWAEISDLLWEGYKQSGSKFSWDDIRNWVNPKLKSLRPQSQWKPSDEQIEILDMVLTNESLDDNIARILRELREQLKKLKGE